MTACGCLHYGAGDTTVQIYGFGAGALRLQDRGYAVLPLARGEKRPHRMLGDQGGVHHATLDPLPALHWWAQDPAANAGVATGSVSRLVVIDLDVKGGDSGIEVFHRYLSDHSLPWPRAPIVQTPSGGQHYWLRTPPGITVPNRIGILPGMDVKGDGGYVVAPPSMLLKFPMVRPGERSRGEPVPVPYRWTAGCPCSVPAAPPWLLPWLCSAPSPQHPGTPSQGEGSDLGELAETGIPVGQRNAQLYRFACQRFRLHGTHPAGCTMVMSDIEHVLGKTDRNDFGRSEVLRIMESARQFVAGQQEAEAAAVTRWRRQ